MRVGFFSDSYYPYISGVVRSIDLFSRELRLLGHDVYIFAPDYPECETEPYIYRFSSVPAPSVPDFRLAIPFMPNITEKVRELNLDVIHTHSPFMMGRLASALAKKLTLPLVFTYHTNYEEFAHYIPLSQKTARRLTVRVTKDFCNRCDVVITPTPIIKSSLSNFGVESPIKVIPTGVDIEKYQRGNKFWMRRRYRFQQEDQVLLYVGRLGEEKNLFFLLDLVKDLMEEMPNLYLMLVGKGPEEKIFRRAAANWDLEHRIIFTGIVTPQKVIDYYLGADIFVFPSKNETQGLVILEAMAAGLPVIAVDKGGPTAIIEDGVDGFLAKADKEEFKTRIKELLKDQSKRKRMGEEARKKANILSACEMTKRLEQIYLEISGKGSQRNKKSKSQG